MEAGATGFLLKDAPGDASSPPRSGGSPPASGSWTRRSPLAALSEGANPLSEREREVLALACDRRHGRRDRRSAWRSREGTVRNHLSAAIQKVGARNRAEAARIAGDKGWLDPDTTD